MSQILFYAGREDLIGLLDCVDSQASLKYRLMGNFMTDESTLGFKEHTSGVSIPGLGVALAESSTLCSEYLVCKQSNKVNVRVFDGFGGKRFCVDQLDNPDSVVFAPGGAWQNRVILRGRVATVSSSSDVKSIMRLFKACMTRSFKKVHAFYVGPQAISLFDQGKRLTASAQSPVEYDLGL